MCRDNDPPDHPATKALRAGLDSLILQGAVVRLADPAPDKDPNAVLMQRGQAALIAMFAAAKPVELTFDGEIQRLVRLGDEFEFALQRKAIGDKFKHLGVGVRDIDKAVARLRAAAKPPPGDDLAAPYPVDPPWPGDGELGKVLEEALAQAKRYIVAPEPQLACLVVWAAHAHAIHNEQLGLQKSPRLAIQGREKGCGKTVTLEVVACLSPRARAASSYTTATVYRSMAADHPTLCLDEANLLLRDDAKSDIVAVLNSGDRRSSAWIDRAVPTPKNGWRVERFNVFGAVALAGIDELPETLQDRSVRIFLRKVSGDKVPEHLRDGTSPKLVELRRQLAAWAANATALPQDPEMPAVLLRQAGRVGDNWRVLFSIAQAASGRWPELIEAAVLAELGSEQRLPLLERLLNSTTLPLPASGPSTTS
jgi:hypothetical protein